MKNIVLLIFAIWASETLAQTTKRYPVIGEPLPVFTLSEVHHFTRRSISSEALKGKYLILDFWSVGCTVCLESFPKISALQEKFKDDIQFMLVGKTDHKFGRNVRQVFERVRSVKKLNLAIAYDSALFKQFGIQFTPHLVVVDPNGMVQAITSSDDMTEENLRKLIEGKPTSFQRKYNLMERDPVDLISADEVFQANISSIPEGAFVYKSLLSRWTREMPIYLWSEFSSENVGLYRTTCMSLERLYLMAYLGQAMWSPGDSLYTSFSLHPVLELKDPSPFLDDFEKAMGLYNYCLVIPEARANKNEMMRMMRSDLAKYFGYEAKIETRRMPCLKLQVDPNAKKKLISQKGSATQRSTNDLYDPIHLSLKNKPVAELLSILYDYHRARFIIDDTGLKDTSIDLEIDVVLTDFQDIERALKENGLLFVPDTRKMQVLVIRDGTSTGQF